MKGENPETTKANRTVGAVAIRPRCPMKNASHFNFKDFTWQHYSELLCLAQKSYTFRTFDSFKRNEHFVIWRHDVDFSVQAAKNLARMEAEVGVVATYFFSLHSEFYNLLDRDNTAAVSEILDLGHRIGLHFDADFHGVATESQFEQLLIREKTILEDLFGRAVNVFSLHNPTIVSIECRHWQYGGLINVYSDYFRTEVGYCSDSNGYWRHRRLEDVLRAATDERLQVLTHPGWWQKKVMSPKERVWRCIDGRAERTKYLYEAALRDSGRENIDWK